MTGLRLSYVRLVDLFFVLPPRWVVIVHIAKHDPTNLAFANERGAQTWLSTEEQSCQTTQIPCRYRKDG